VKVGLTGFSGAGKTTVFTALTGLRSDAGDRRSQMGTIKVPDGRVDFLASVYSPKKTTYAEVTFVDFPPTRDAQKRGVLDQEMVTALRDADALVEVVDAFDGELVLADLAQVEKRVERCRKEKGRERELALLARLEEHLDAGAPLRTLRLGAEERVELAGFAFLSLRPLLVVLNVAEPEVASPVPAAIAERARAAGGEAMALSAKVEAELAELEPGDRAAFLADLGLTESARDRFIRASYGLLDLISFLTAGEDECRAWPIRRGTTARKAAGRIHSDIERGFIRAEVMAYDDFVQHPSEAKCREAGKLRLEGKDYVVQDGDIVHFRFAV
jgi:ribosome-binding ATPase YchF (GTP1/OBG family)